MAWAAELKRRIGIASMVYLFHRFSESICMISGMSH